MSTIRAKYKKCRKYGSTIFEKCSSAKYAISEQKKRFAVKGKRRTMLTEYGKKLIEKQKIRLSYGLKEKKLRSYVFNAIDSPNETYSEIYTSLEKRLDNVIYRIGLGDSRAMSRQMVSHGHVMVNGRKLNIPSYPVKIGDKISVRTESKDRKYFEGIDKKDMAKVPKWISFDFKKLEGEIKGIPEINAREFDFAQVVEFYTR
jgi:small subunit ribosomal protein S4